MLFVKEGQSTQRNLVFYGTKEHPGKLTLYLHDKYECKLDEVPHFR